MSEHCTVVYKQRPYLKGQCLEFCFTFFNQKTLFGPHINRQKQASQNFRFAKILYSQKTCICVVVDYADTRYNLLLLKQKN